MKTAPVRKSRRTQKRPPPPWNRETVSHGEMLAPIGPLRILVGPRGVMRIDLPNAPPPDPKDLRRELDVRGMGDLPLVVEDERVKLVKDQFREYFAGKRKRFDLPLDARGADFDQKVWRFVAAIKFGTTATYAAAARAIGYPKAFRAVGAANGRNPVPILVPCHRVVGTGGKLTGYGGGVALKAWLLRHEGLSVEGERVEVDEA